MDHQHGSTTVCYQYGYRLFLKSVDSDVPMSLIDQDVWQEFSGDLPVHYSISFYDPIQKKSIKLDQEVLDGDGNPFRLNRNEIVDNMGGVRQNVHLYINDDASALPGTSQPQSSVENIDSHYSHAGLQQRHQDVSLLSSHPNDGSCNDNILSQSLFRDDPEDDIRNTDDNTQAYQSNIVDSGNNCTTGDNELDDFFSSDPMIIEVPITQDINNTTGPPITVDDAMPSSHSLPVPKISRNINQTVTQPLAQQPSHQLNRFYFCHDVKPEQKAVYLSDKYNQEDEAKLNGGIPRIQAVKKEQDKMKSVLPKVRIPAFIRNNTDAFVVVYVVSEEQKDGKRFWFKHRDKGFLPGGFTRETQSINPIELALHGNNSCKAGVFKLGLRMVTWWKKKYQPEPVYQLDEEATLRVHLAAHDPSSPRLLAVLRVGHRYYWDLFCLSDFIRAPTKRAPTARPKKSSVSPR